MQTLAFTRRRRFGWLVAVAAALVAAGDMMFWHYHLHGGQYGFYLMAMMLAAVALRPAMWRDGRAITAAGAALLFAGAFANEPGLLAWSLFWIAAGMAVLLPATGRFDDGWRWFQRLLLHALRTLIAPVLDLRRVLRARAWRRPGRFSLARAFAVAGLPVAGSAVIVILFASANPVLDRFLSTLANVDVSSMGPGRVLFWLILFLMAWALLHPRPRQTLLGTFDGSGDLPLPGVSAASVTLSLIAFNLLFALQNAMDVAYMGGLLAMPEGITLAEYAHRGAYPLIATALLAALFVLVTLRPGSTTAAVPAIRALVVLWIAQNLVLVGSSILRTVDYVEVYSLTEFRMAALAWMALVGLGLVFICWRMLAGRSAGWLINVNLAAAGLVLTGFSLVDTAAIAASWNVRHAREAGGKGAELDLCYLNGLGGSALAALIELEQRPGLRPDFRERVHSVRREVMDRLRDEVAEGGWSLRGARQLAQGEAAVAAMPKPAALKPGWRGCDGAIIPETPPPPALDTPEAPAPAVPVTPAAPPPATADYGGSEPARPGALTAEPGR